MPLPPIAPNNTGRLFVDYSANGRAHTVQFRYATAGAPTTGFLEAVDDLFIVANALMPSNWTFIGWRYVAQGSIVSVPVPGAPTPFAGLITPKTGEAPAFYTLVGRTPGGRKLRATLLGAGYSPADENVSLADYRWQASENAQVAALIDAWEALPPVGVDGQTAAVYPYINLGYNVYWQKQVRS